MSVAFTEYHDDAFLRRILRRKCSLRVHMAALSRSFVEDQAGRRYITLIGQAKTTVALVTVEALWISGWRRCEESLRCWG